MNKADLAEKWGKYCDTNAMVETFRHMLAVYGYRESEHGVCKMLDTYFTNKEDLIKLLEKSDNYIGDMRIALDVELERQGDRYQLERFCRRFLDEINIKGIMLTKTDEHGKTLSDYLRTGVSKVTVKQLMDKEFVEKLKAIRENYNKFDGHGYLISSIDECDYVSGLISDIFGRHVYPKLSRHAVEYAERHQLKVKLVEDMKTSRAFNRVCATYKLDKAPNYQKLFAEYADMVSDLKRKLKFFISVNPLDYLTMSNGVNWTSCHNVGQHGGYCGGAMSYMLDHSSIITFVHTDIPEDFVHTGKIYRNMFHFENDVLIQSRIYPQSNDGLTDLYKVFRGVVQDELTKLLKLESTTWVLKKEGKCTANITHNGVQYPDYNHNSACNASYPKERAESSHNIVTIGHNRICTYCGEEIPAGVLDSSRWHHNNCRLPITFAKSTRINWGDMTVNVDGATLNIIADDDWNIVQ